MTQPVSHPGPRPEALRYPFEEVRAAAAAADDLAAALERAIGTHRSHGQQSLAPDTPFRGASAQRLREALDDTLAQVGRLVHRLDASVEALNHGMAQARAAEQDRLHAQRAWDRRLADHRAWVASGSGAPR